MDRANGVPTGLQSRKQTLHCSIERSFPLLQSNVLTICSKQCAITDDSGMEVQKFCTNASNHVSVDSNSLYLPAIQ